MDNSINIVAIALVNLVGVLLLCTMGLSNLILLKRKNLESTLLRIMIFVVLACCITDTACFYCDGKDGALSRFVVIVGNWFIFACNMIIAPLWAFIINNHIFGRLGKIHVHIIHLVMAIGYIPLIINLFYPLVYEVDINNVYSRLPFSNFYGYLQVFFLLDCIAMYTRGKRKGGVFKFFPVLQFLIPALVGLLLQGLCYGVSMTWACMAVALSGLLFGLQNERIYQDSLTGLYNRPYLDYVKREVTKKNEQYPITMMLMDLDGFKSINDRFGHLEGDKALICVAEILTKAIGAMGSIIRYAGDEFVVLLNTQDEALVNACVEEINASFAAFNETGAKEYELELSIGTTAMDFKERTIDEIFEYVDAKMYVEKKRKKTRKSEKAEAEAKEADIKEGTGLTSDALKTEERKPEAVKKDEGKPSTEKKEEAKPSTEKKPQGELQAAKKPQSKPSSQKKKGKKSSSKRRK